MSADLENSNSGDQADRFCDFCNEPKALLYCRADSAKLCFNCDREVHSTNQLFQKHSRALLCDVCNSSPSTIFCRTDSVVLCQNCDWETHKNFRAVHDRRPIEGFNGCPSVTELLNCLGLEDLGKKNLVYGGGKDDGLLDLFVWETPSVLSLDDLIVSNESVDSGHSFQAMGVPPLPKNRNAACGKHKQEMLSQLREMAKTEPNFSGSLEDLEPFAEFQSQVPGNCQLTDSSPGYECNEVKWCDFTSATPDDGFPPNYVESFIETSHLVPDDDSETAEGAGLANGFQEVQASVPADFKPFLTPPVAGLRELNTQERDHALSRYKQKKKTRRYDKHIRYESRKIRAESRTRIKGRFAKMNR